MNRNRIDIGKVYRENVKLGLAPQEALAMEHSIAAPPLRSLITEKTGLVYWYVFDSPLPRNKRHGVTTSKLKAQEIIDRVLNTGHNDDQIICVN